VDADPVLNGDLLSAFSTALREQTSSGNPMATASAVGPQFTSKGYGPAFLRLPSLISGRHGAYIFAALLVGLGSVFYYL